MTFYGEAGQLRTFFGGHRFYADGKEAPVPAGGKTVEVPRSPGHFRDWLDSIRSRKLPLADVEVGHRTTSLCQLGNIALFTGRKLRWDAVGERFEGDRGPTTSSRASTAPPTGRVPRAGIEVRLPPGAARSVWFRGNHLFLDNLGTRSPPGGGGSAWPSAPPVRRAGSTAASVRA